MTWKHNVVAIDLENFGWCDDWRDAVIKILQSIHFFVEKHKGTPQSQILSSLFRDILMTWKDQYDQWIASLDRETTGDEERKQRRLRHVTYYMSRDPNRHSYGKSYELDYDIAHFLIFINDPRRPPEWPFVNPPGHSDSCFQRCRCKKQQPTT